MLLAVGFLAEVKPRLDQASLTCPSHGWTTAVDYIVLSGFVYHGVALVACRVSPQAAWEPRVRRTLMLLFPCSFLFVVVKLVSMSDNVISEECGMIIMESWWLFVLMGHLPGKCPATAPARAPLKKKIFEHVWSEVGKIVDRMDALKWEPRSEETDTLEHTQCAICLGEWEPGDVIKVTPCEHAFHSDCFHKWLASQMCKTGTMSCAVCRRDLTTAEMLV
jgi:hypothetical protein